jgi:signal transduction histidine kinase
VRVRVLAAMLGLTALGMLAAGVVLAGVQLGRIDERLDRSLAQEVAEFRGIVEQDDPATGRPWTQLDEALRAGVARQVPDENQEVVAVVDGRVAYRPAQAEHAGVTDDPALLAAVSAVDRPAFGQLTGAEGNVRWAALPVAVQGDPRQGVLVSVALVQPERDELVDALRTYALASMLTLVVVGLVGWVVAGRLLRPLRDVRSTAERITDTDLSERIEVSGSDEVSALAATFNGMLDRLQHAFADQRQFLDDAGHELRTPLTIVRGHLELMDAGDPTEVAESRVLVLDELDRMSRLVDDMVLLAKSEQPDFVRPREVELGVLVDEVLDKARPLAERSWVLDARADAQVAADPQRLTQALVQLVSNAVRHTGPGDTIAVGAAVLASGVRVWVRDSGPGVPAADRERIFGRFERGSGSGEGRGLGLAIVRAIAEAHGGTATVEPVSGSGARFVLTLPLTCLLSRPRSGETHDTVPVPVVSP